MVRPGRASSSAPCSWSASPTSTTSLPLQSGGGSGVEPDGVAPVVSSGVAGTVVRVPDASPEGLDGLSDSQELSASRSPAASRAPRAPLLVADGELMPVLPAAANG